MAKQRGVYEPLATSGGGRRGLFDPPAADDGKPVNKHLSWLGFCAVAGMVVGAFLVLATLFGAGGYLAALGGSIFGFAILAGLAYLTVKALLNVLRP